MNNLAVTNRISVIDQKLKDILEESKTVTEGVKSCLRVEYRLLVSEKRKLEKTGLDG